MSTNFGLKEFKSNTLLLIDPAAQPIIGDLVLTLTLNLGYQVLAVKVNAGQPEYFSLGAKLSQLGALQGVEVLGLVIEAVHNENLKGFVLRHAPEILLSNSPSKSQRTLRSHRQDGDTVRTKRRHVCSRGIDSP